MLKETAIAHYGSMAKLARALKITVQAVSDWGNLVPEGRAYQIQILTKGAIKVDRKAYIKPPKISDGCAK
jgi:transcriptional repressor of cell division inhibition gene dicB